MIRPVKGRPNLSLVIPFYNEEDCVAQVILEVHASLVHLGLAFEIVAVQNGSGDRTPQLLGQLEQTLGGLRVVGVPKNLGFGYGVLRGLDASVGDMLGFMPGDGQIDPAALGLVLSRMAETQADICKGRRIIRHDGWQRRLVSTSYNLLARIFFGVTTDDLNGHPKLMTRHAYTAMRIQSADHFIDAEIMLKAQWLGLRVSEVDLEFRKRETGRSKVHLLAGSLEFLRNLFLVRLGIRKLWNESPDRREALVESRRG